MLNNQTLLILVLVVLSGFLLTGLGLLSGTNGTNGTNGHTKGITSNAYHVPFYGDIEEMTKENENYREVLYTTDTMQLVLMSLKSGEDIGMEVHPNVSQFFRIEAGQGLAIVNGKQYSLKDDDALLVPPGSSHNIVNTHPCKRLQLYSIYAPPQHPPNTVQKAKPEGEEHDH